MLGPEVFGPPSTMADRYQVHLDCRKFVGRLANTFDHTPYAQVPMADKLEFRQQVLKEFARIPVDVAFVHGPEPYASLEEMTNAINRDNQFLCKWRGDRNGHVLGAGHMFFRAMHDWYGHYKPQNPFTMDGEIAAFREHADSRMFNHRTLPLVWSEVVLENAYRLYHGHWYRWYKPVFDPLWGRVDDWEDVR